MTGWPHEAVVSVAQQPYPDTELHQRLVYGDETALAEVYDEYGALVHRVAGRVTRSPAAAEDVAQEVFAHLWSRPYAFDARRGSLRTWLCMLAHRRAVDWVRGEERHRKAAHADDSTLHTIPTPDPPPEDVVMARERSLLLHSALARLPLPQRQVVHLAYFAGRTYRQAAVELGIPEGTAKTRLRAALRRLAEALAEPPDPSDPPDSPDPPDSSGPPGPAHSSGPSDPALADAPGERGA